MKKRMISLILIAIMAVSLLSACEPEEQKETETVEMPLVVGYTSFNELFSPFFAKTSADKDVVAMTQVNLLTLDREGSVIYHAIDGETRAYNDTDYTYYGIADIDVKKQNNGTVAYDITLRDDVKFSDGEVLNAEDLIFSMYVLCDPLYDGPYTLGKAPIVGLQEYQSSMVRLFDVLVAAGRENTEFTHWDQATQEKFWKELETAGTQFAQDIVDYLEESSGTTSIADAATLWGYEGLPENASATEFFYMMCKAHEWNLEELNETERVGKSLFNLMENYDAYATGVQIDLDVPYIAGIEMTGEYSVRVVMTEQNAANIHYLNIPVAPMHYYGNPSLFQYEQNTFGFVKGDLSLLHQDANHPNKDVEPMGAGPYVFVPTETDDEEKSITINYSANEDYYLGAPKTKQVNFVEIASAKKINGIVKGTVDLTDVSLTKKVASNIAQANQNATEEAVVENVEAGTAPVEVVSCTAFDYPGYGYIGINANLVNVNGDADSKASVNLRKAFATLYSAYRDEFVDIYFGGNATVVEKDAYTESVDGKEIYSDEMTKEEKYAAAKEASLAYFKAAGYTVEDNIVKAAPQGASMQFEVMVAGNSLGEHPAYMTLLHTKAALAELGINLTVKDVVDENEMWTALENGTCQMWAAAWDITPEPDIYEMYHTDGAYSYMYGIDDDTLSADLEKARTTLKESTRMKLYKKCYDKVLDWAVEVPVYQKQNAIIYSKDRINADTMTADMTEYYGWLKEVHNIEMYDVEVEVE